MRLSHWIPSLPLFVLLACSSGTGEQSLVIEPVSPTVKVGEQLTLTAIPQEDLSQDPEWEIQELHGGGLLTSKGLRSTYVAPPSAGRYHLILRGARPDGSRVKSVTEIRVLPFAQLEPSQAHVLPGGTVTFLLKLKGLPRNTATWKVEEADGGSISQDGVYTAPSHSGTFHVVATSTLDPDASAQAIVQVD